MWKPAPPRPESPQKRAKTPGKTERSSSEKKPRPKLKPKEPVLDGNVSSEVVREAKTRHTSPTAKSAFRPFRARNFFMQLQHSEEALMRVSRHARILKMRTWLIRILLKWSQLAARSGHGDSAHLWLKRRERMRERGLERRRERRESVFVNGPSSSPEGLSPSLDPSARQGAMSDRGSGPNSPSTPSRQQAGTSPSPLRGRHTPTKAEPSPNPSTASIAPQVVSSHTRILAVKVTYNMDEGSQELSSPGKKMSKEEIHCLVERLTTAGPKSPGKRPSAPWARLAKSPSKETALSSNSLPADATPGTYLRTKDMPPRDMKMTVAEEAEVYSRTLDDKPGGIEAILDRVNYTPLEMKRLPPDSPTSAKSMRLIGNPPLPIESLSPTTRKAMLRAQQCSTPISPGTPGFGRCFENGSTGNADAAEDLSSAERQHDIDSSKSSPPSQLPQTLARSPSAPSIVEVGSAEERFFPTPNAKDTQKRHVSSRVVQEAVEELLANPMVARAALQTTAQPFPTTPPVVEMTPSAAANGPGGPPMPEVAAVQEVIPAPGVQNTLRNDKDGGGSADNGAVGEGASGAAASIEDGSREHRARVELSGPAAPDAAAGGGNDSVGDGAGSDSRAAADSGKEESSCEHRAPHDLCASVVPGADAAMSDTESEEGMSTEASATDEQPKDSTADLPKMGAPSEESQPQEQPGISTAKDAKTELRERLRQEVAERLANKQSNKAPERKGGGKLW
ncbi:hypothetical protein CYMTET_21207 [Cymbomonas tetramitiformis]|uniref:Uncharacterized protein n=1 Tax=Cymbomonas tetramitiformis TaxID=36881 RepID=A0AAE0G2D6_9CHLO|nr:hypothetical protein CYMTET_21207 [Cymbomonas tetramitiformis]